MERDQLSLWFYMLRFYLKTLVAAALLLTGCVYEPKDIYVNPVDEPDIQVALSLNSYDDHDTIYVFDETIFNYDAVHSSGLLKSVKVLFDNREIHSSTEASGEFGLNDAIYGFNTGVHELTVEFITTTGSGSLADKFGAEQVNVWRTWKVVVDIDAPPVPTLQFSNENGYLKLTWQKYSKPNFRKYTVTKNVNGESRTIEIKDSLQNSWIDSTFIGSNFTGGTYSVRVTGKEASYALINNPPAPYKLFATFNPSDSIASLRWTKTAYYSALKHYIVTIDNAITSEQLITTDTSINVKVKELKLDAQIAFSLLLIPDKGNSVKGEGTSVASTRVLRPFKFLTMDYHDVLHHYTARATNSKDVRYAYVFNEQLKATDSLVLAATTSLPHNSTRLYYGMTGEFGYYDLPSFTQTRILYTGGRVDFSASVNGLMAFNNTVTRTTQPRTTYYGTVIDLSSKDTLFHTSSTSSFKTRISADGKFVANISASTTQFYQYDGTGFTSAGQLPFTTWQFRDDAPHEIIRYSAYKLDIYNATDLTLVRTINVDPVGSSYRVGAYDPASHYILLYGLNDLCLAVNIETGAYKKFYSNTEPELVNGFLFCNNGRYVKLL